MRILLVKMSNSVFNRSIWEGLSRAWQSKGHVVTEVDAHDVPRPMDGMLPDLLFAVHGGTVPAESVDAYRRRGVITAVYLLDEPYEVDRSVKWSRHYDVVFSVDRQTVPIHATAAEAHHLPLAYDSDRFHPAGRSYASEILILGSPFAHRLSLLAPLRERWGRHTTWVGPGWQPFCPEGRHVEQLVTADICARFYRGARFVVNIHRNSSWSHYGEANASRIEATHLNPRFWEAAGCGGFQLCSYREDLHAFAEHVLPFETAEQLDRLIAHYWDRDEERRTLSGRAREAVQPHSYLSRAEEILRRIKHLPAAHDQLEQLHAVGKENPPGDDK